MACKHGISDEKTCWFCSGNPQTNEVKEGPPQWAIHNTTNNVFDAEVRREITSEYYD